MKLKYTLALLFLVISTEVMSTEQGFFIKKRTKIEYLEGKKLTHHDFKTRQIYYIERLENYFRSMRNYVYLKGNISTTELVDTNEKQVIITVIEGFIVNENGGEICFRNDSLTFRANNTLMEQNSDFYIQCEYFSKFNDDNDNNESHLQEGCMFKFFAKDASGNNAAVTFNDADKVQVHPMGINFNKNKKNIFPIKLGSFEIDPLKEMLRQEINTKIQGIKTGIKTETSQTIDIFKAQQQEAEDKFNTDLNEKITNFTKTIGQKIEALKTTISIVEGFNERVQKIEEFHTSINQTIEELKKQIEAREKEPRDRHKEKTRDQTDETKKNPLKVFTKENFDFSEILKISEEDYEKLGKLKDKVINYLETKDSSTFIYEINKFIMSDSPEIVEGENSIPHKDQVESKELADAVTDYLVQQETTLNKYRKLEYVKDTLNKINKNPIISDSDLLKNFGNLKKSLFVIAKSEIFPFVGNVNIGKVVEISGDGETVTLATGPGKAIGIVISKFESKEGKSYCLVQYSGTTNIEIRRNEANRNIDVKAGKRLGVGASGAILVLDSNDQNSIGKIVHVYETKKEQNVIQSKVKVLITMR